jgi:hypothetical protein
MVKIITTKLKLSEKKDLNQHRILTYIRSVVVVVSTIFEYGSERFLTS